MRSSRPRNLVSSCLCIVLLAPGACRSVDDSGEVCLFPAGEVTDPFDPSMLKPVAFAADVPLLAIALITHSGGERLRDMHCTLERRGDVIHVGTHYRDPPGDPQDNLQLFRVECSLVGLPAGTYTVVYGNDEQTLRVPSSVPPLCFEGE